jgi:hypothetical protein
MFDNHLRLESLVVMAGGGGQGGKFVKKVRVNKGFLQRERIAITLG